MRIFIFITKNGGCHFNRAKKVASYDFARILFNALVIELSSPKTEIELLKLFD